MEGTREITETKCVWLYFPPEEVFLEPRETYWGYQSVQTVKFSGYKFLLPEKGMFFLEPNKLPYPGIPCPTIVQAVAAAKRLVMGKVRSVINLIRWRRTLWEIADYASATVRRYYLKPHRYCRSVREIYRVLNLFFPIVDDTSNGYDLVHLPCMVLEFDSGYRFPAQAFFGNLDGEELKKHPYRAIMRELAFAAQESNVGDKWRKVQKMFRWAWFLSPAFRRMVRKVAKEINLNEIRMDENDLYYQFH